MNYVADSKRRRKDYLPSTLLSSISVAFVMPKRNPDSKKVRYQSL